MPGRSVRLVLVPALILACANRPDAAVPESPEAEWERVFATGRRWSGQDADAAARYYERAQELAARFPAGDLRGVRTEQALGEVRRRQGRLDEASRLLEDAVAGAELHGAEEPLLLAETLESLALLRVMQGRLDEAEADLERALALRTGELGSESADAAATRVKLAEVQRRVGRHREAESNLLEAASVYGRDGRRHALRIATIQHNLGLLYQDQQRFAEAEVQHREAILLARRVREVDNPNLAIFSRGLADLYVRTGRREQAEDLYRWSYETLERTLGPSHLETRLTRSRLEQLGAGVP